VSVQSVFDAAWRERALQGDREAVRLLPQVGLGPLYRFCFYRVGRNRHLCEDVVQETLVQAIRNVHRYEPQRSENNILPWLTGLARNEIRRALAHASSTTSLEAMWARMDDRLRDILARLESDPLTDEILQREETREMVNATMSQLPSHYRDALEQKYVSGQSVRDIASARSMTEKAVESLLTRARRAFRETFLALEESLDPETAG